MIDSFLRLSRSTRGELTVQQFNLSRLVETIDQRLREKEPQRQIDMRIEPDIHIDGDPKTVSLVGGSMGGGAAADAVAETEPGEINALVLLAALASTPKKLTVPKLFIVARDDANADGTRLPKIRAQFDAAPEPKELIVLDGSAHAQFLFHTEQAERVMREILRFLSAQ
jgi:pimeloyl-ACP methyl ester carboxylesterase